LVHLGIWDFGVDANHCLLKDVVHVTQPRSPRMSPATLPPDKATKCGEARATGYELSMPFDHGTGVAGILAAHRTGGAPVTGMIPGVKIWAWQVVHPLQFEAAGPLDVLSFAAAYKLDPKVINVSQSYEIEHTGRSNLENLLFGQGD